VCGIHVVVNGMKWSAFYVPPCISIASSDAEINSKIYANSYAQRTNICISLELIIDNRYRFVGSILVITVILSIIKYRI